MTLHWVGLGLFFEAGVKKPATAFSASCCEIKYIRRGSSNLLVVVDSNFRLIGGGDTESLSASRFIAAYIVVVTARQYIASTYSIHEQMEEA